MTAVVLSLAAAVAVGSAAHLTHPVERLAASARAGPLTVSVGVAVIDPGESGSAASLVARGMRALEQAKAARRNAVRADIAA